MVQKAWAAGFVALVSVSAPSSLAVATAERAGLVLAGFSRSGRTTVYAGLDRVVV
jgi:FdhD protein